MPKLNLITAPDKLLNENPSILMVNPSLALKQEFNDRAKHFEKDVNVYMFEVGDPDEQSDLKWLIEIINFVDTIVFDINGTFRDRWLIGYILNKNNCYYVWTGSDVFGYQLINQNKIYDLEFLTNKINKLESN